jgi:hypothetical protein
VLVRLVAAGRSNREIAAELFISVKTASVHVSNILAKLGAAGRAEAAAIAVRADLAAADLWLNARGAANDLAGGGCSDGKILRSTDAGRPASAATSKVSRGGRDAPDVR